MFHSHGKTRQNRFQITRHIKSASTHLHKPVEAISVNKIQSEQIMQKKNKNIHHRVERWNNKFKNKERHMFFYLHGRNKPSLELEYFEMQ